MLALEMLVISISFLDTYDRNGNAIPTAMFSYIFLSPLHCIPDHGCVTVRPVSPVSVSSVPSVPAIVALPYEATMKEGPEQVSLGQEGGGHQSSLTWHMTWPMRWCWHSPCRSPSPSWGQPRHPGPGRGSRGGRQAAHRESPTVHSANRLDDAVRSWLEVSFRNVVVQFVIIILWSLLAFNEQSFVRHW
mgnify:CR=1 FL=1